MCIEAEIYTNEALNDWVDTLKHPLKQQTSGILMLVLQTILFPFFLSLRSMIDVASLVRGNGKLSLQSDYTGNLWGFHSAFWGAFSKNKW